ncbi:MAG: endonuclease [Candidatus Vogelbacteria bacterium CG10_big_fil_rev_8_21_14_0_10_51_16]|uniref:Endonuclease n=1 Tax=Candidatus Vogelbacteria bacterium CG10_big_fil_rev_8_21_14_0_10_51_16 TaxID=1975045 RepID=A0A2H0REL8_9BACT|nr:MAG: endonuclease [Candidatus Vogelbacteria bacterium CG10_big_fil_rev_8_21_14_0_10_51_16]
MDEYNTPTLRRELSNYISGYVDGEGCFCVSFSKRPKLNMGWEVKPSFAVGQNYDRREVLDLMMEHFACGFLRRDYGDKTLKYEIRSLKELLSKVIPHFLAFPLKSAKQKDFLLFADICERMGRSEHLHTEGFKAIVDIACQMNSSSKRRYAKSEVFATSSQMKI